VKGNSRSVTHNSLSRLPFAGAEPHTRADFQHALLELCEPFADPASFDRQLDALSGQPHAHYGPRVARLELVARLLWGLAPLAAGGGEYRGWPQIREAIAAGTDPEDPQYWGRPTDRDQRIVEAAGLGFGLALCPQELWDPLDATLRAHLSGWLRDAAHCRTYDNNWLLFATVVGLGLARVGEPLEPSVAEEAFRRVDAFYLGDGWYADGGPSTARDHYGPWALHFYSLINAQLSPLSPLDANRAATAKERARAFAPHYLDWFAADGAGLAFGRSMTYRFAQAAFLGATAFADEPGPAGWGVLRGAWARHLRWWARQPILNGDGTLSIGYAYPNLHMSEAYNSPASPYWALKAFLPLALPDSHPFWTHEEEPLHRTPAVRAHPHAGMLISHDRAGHATALAAAPGAPWSRHRHAEAKYAKFAYSTAFGFAVPTAVVGLEAAAVDSVLALSEDGEYWRTRRETVHSSITDEAVHAVWHPWPDVEIETRLRFAGDWQIRDHRITTARPLHTAEGAFCVPLEDQTRTHTTDSSALAISKERASGIQDPSKTATRQATVLRPDPNSHFLWQRTLLPILRGTLEPGEHLMITAVFANSTGDAADFEHPPVNGSGTKSDT
jgi:hypothetical protein